MRQFYLETISAFIYGLAGKNQWNCMERKNCPPHPPYGLEYGRILLIIFKGCAWNKFCSLDCLKAKNEVELKNSFSFEVKKTNLSILGAKKIEWITKKN